MLKILTTYLTLFALVSSPVFSQETPYVEGELIVMLHKGVSPDLLSSRYNANPALDNGFKHQKMLSELSNIHLFEFNPAAIADKDILKLITGDEMVRAAQFNHFVQERNVPNDPQLGSQWHHVNGNDKDIDSDLAWDITTGGTTANGDEIVVCVIEPGGTNYNHVDLIANHWRNTAEIPNNGIDDDGNGYVDDYDGWRPSNNSDNIQLGGHGTAVSGMIGAKGNNGIGGSGVNWDVKIMQVQIGSLTESNVIAAYAYPHTMRNIYNNTNGAQGAFVVATNASWGIDNANPLNYPVWCNYYDDLGEAGILNCGATANNNVNIDVVGDMPTGCGSSYMVSVTATNNNDQRTFSAYGATTIDLGAPGSSVFLPSGSSSYSNTSGTSFASPCVAGAIALVYSAPCSELANLALSNPQSTADNVRNYIFNGVDPVSQLATETVTGGRLNVKNALDLAMEACAPQVDLDAALTGVGNPEGTCCNESEFIPVVTLFNAGANNLTSVSFNYGISGQPTSSFVWTGNLSTGTSIAVNLPAVSVTSSGSYQFTATIGAVNGQSDENPANNSANSSFEVTLDGQQISLDILLDCWGSETTWQIQLSGSPTLLASGGPYTNGTEGTTVSSDFCLAPGCYTFTIFDSFGDGLAGSGYTFCGVDGDYTITGADGTVLVSMPVANFGSQAVHDFCIEEDDPTVPCTTPYPQVTGLTSTVQSNGVVLTWNPIPGSLGCQIEGGLNGSTSLQQFQVIQNELSTFFVPASQLPLANETYRWRVRCGCSLNPPIAGPWTPFSTFFWPASGSKSIVADHFRKDLEIFPNPTSGRLVASYELTSSSPVTIQIFNMVGQLVFTEMQVQDSGLQEIRLDLSNLSAGIYLFQIDTPSQSPETARLIISK